jgi:hypothetical protein
VLGRGALTFFFSILVIIIKIARAGALALIAMSSPSFSILAGGILKIAQLHRRDRAACIVKIWSVHQQIHNINKLGGNLADLCPNSPNSSVRVVPHSSDEVQIDSWIPALHNGKRGLHTGSEGRIKHDGKLAGSSLQVPSNIFIRLQDNGLGARSEKHIVQLLDTGFISAQSTLHMGYPSIQGHSKILDIPASIRSNSFTPHKAGSSNSFVSNMGRIGPGI